LDNIDIFNYSFTLAFSDKHQKFYVIYHLKSASAKFQFSDVKLYRQENLANAKLGARRPRYSRRSLHS